VKRPSFSRQDSAASTHTNNTQDASGTTTPKSRPTISRPNEGKKSQKSKKGEDKDYKLEAGADIQGIVMIEVANAADLPKLKNSKHSLRRRDSL
jgi:hypothetical protein